ncbi:hypothetical protein VE04_09884 [Pseudogymnoascus sp. 24MN13]|nr:hypothetical protein VE04_09884 [Pseudogymnoascus sp. 24MN13]
MARHKQATPLRREVSSEYTSSADRVGTPTKISRTFDSPAAAAAPMKVNGRVNGAVVAPTVAVKVEKKKQAGLVELVIGVAGIYASLYVPPHSPHLQQKKWEEKKKRKKRD